MSDLLKGAKAGTLVFSCLKDKPAAEMAQILFSLFERVIVAPIHAARATALPRISINGLWQDLGALDVLLSGAAFALVSRRATVSSSMECPKR